MTTYSDDIARAMRQAEIDSIPDVPKRPRRYADRRWLEGYEDACKDVRQDSRGNMAVYVAVMRRFAQEGRPDAKTCGRIDAWLDAVGC